MGEYGENLRKKTRSMEVLMGKIIYEWVIFHCHVYRRVNLCLDNHCNEGPIFDLRSGIASQSTTDVHKLGGYPVYNRMKIIYNLE